jgi:hypothetical protein
MTSSMNITIFNSMVTNFIFKIHSFIVQLCPRESFEWSLRPKSSFCGFLRKRVTKFDINLFPKTSTIFLTFLLEPFHRPSKSKKFYKRWLSLLNYIAFIEVENEGKKKRIKAQKGAKYHLLFFVRFERFVEGFFIQNRDLTNGNFHRKNSLETSTFSFWVIFLISH